MLNRLQDVFASFQRHEVRYLVIGGIAAVLHGVPRATLLGAEELLANEITIFKDRVRIDVQTSTPGLDFATAWKDRQVMRYHDQPFFVVSKQDLIRSKRAAGRPVDLEDVRLLELDGSEEAQP